MTKISTSFRNASAFGKRIKYFDIGLMLKEGLEVHLPLEDDNAIDAVIKKANGSYVKVQIKAQSDNASFGDAAIYTDILHKPRKNYLFIFFFKRLSLQE